MTQPATSAKGAAVDLKATLDKVAGIARAAQEAAMAARQVAAEQAGRSIAAPGGETGAGTRAQ